MNFDHLAACDGSGVMAKVSNFTPEASEEKNNLDGETVKLSG